MGAALRHFRAGFVILVTLLATASSAGAEGLYGLWFPKGLSTYAGEIDHLHDIIFVITGLVFVATEGLLLWFLFRYRAQPGRKAIYSHGNNAVEITWTLIPVVIFLFLGIRSAGLWARLKDPTSMPGDCLEVRAIGRQFEWHFEYPAKGDHFDDTPDHKAEVIETTNDFEIPAGRNIKVLITSRDVIHSFFLPTMRLKQDAVPGMVVPAWFQATPEAIGQDLQVACAELCGLGHYRMKAKFKVLSEADFEAFKKKNSDD